LLAEELATSLSVVEQTGTVRAQVEVVIGPTELDPGDKVDPGKLNAPFAVCFEPNGEMWIVEYDGGRLLRWTHQNELLHVAGDGTLGYADGTALQARFNKLHNVCRYVDGRLFLSDHQNATIRCYDPGKGLIYSLSGSGKAGFSGDGGPYQAATFAEPICVELTPDNRFLLVADIRNLRIRRLDLQSETITTIAGNGQRGVPKDGGLAVDSPLYDPRAAVMDQTGNIYLLERSGNVLRKIDAAGRITTLAGTGKPGKTDGPALQATMHGPKHLCVSPSGKVYIADDNNHAIRCYDPETEQLTTVDLGGFQLNRPHGVAVFEGWLYIADSYNHRILRVRL
jgi:sugar lactone lactonase YvrE